LLAVVVGLVALTTAACVLSYSSVHDFALNAGIKPSLARIYPDIADAMLAIAGCSVLALRGAGLLSKVYGWLSFVVLLGALAATSAAHEAGLSMPRRAAEITAAVFPWALVLVAFGLLLALLRYARRRRQSQGASSAADALASSRLTAESPALEAGALEASAIDPAELEPGDYEDAEGYDAAAYADSGEYEASEPYQYVMLQPTSQSQYPALSPGEPGEYGAAPAPGEPAALEPPVVSPTVPLPRLAVEPDDAEDAPVAQPAQPAAQPAQPAQPAAQPAQPAAQPPRTIRPTEMQLRATSSRQSESAETPTADAPAADTPAADAPAADTQVTESAPADGPSVKGVSITEPPTSGFTGDTIPRGELSPAPTPDEQSTQPPKLDRPRSSPTPPS
jgi:hypothetical protein